MYVSETFNKVCAYIKESFVRTFIVQPKYWLDRITGNDTAVTWTGRDLVTNVAHSYAWLLVVCTDVPTLAIPVLIVFYGSMIAAFSDFVKHMSAA